MNAWKQLGQELEALQEASLELQLNVESLREGVNDMVRLGILPREHHSLSDSSQMLSTRRDIQTRGEKH